MKKLTDQIKEKLDKGITAISSTISKEPRELIRIKSEIKRLANKKEELMFEFGEMSYESFGASMNENSSLSQKYEEISNLDNEINLLQLDAEKILEMSTQASSKSKALTQCECGAGLDEEQRFCGSCGKNVEQIVQEAIQKKKAEEPITCSDCGAKIPSQAKFCPKCGAPRKKKEPETSEKQPKLEESEIGKETQEMKKGGEKT